ncbi:MAG: hypothetical protein HYX88_02930 [Chloroflexi bacterium]|nr:hypothetical protein [Chloroflexota bacterium]
MKLVGDYLIEEGVLTKEQLYDGLRQAAQIVSSGTYKPIGQILIELGYVTREQLDRALSQQEEDKASG